MKQSIQSKKEARKSKLPVEKEEKEEIMFQKPQCSWPEYVWLKGTAYDSTKNGNKKRNMNMDIRIANFDLSVAGLTLLESSELNITYGTRYGIIGRNGIGKSVLLRAISGREGPFSCIPTWYSILHVEQEIIGDERTPLEIVLASDRERLWLLEEIRKLESVTNEDDEDEEKYTLKDLYERLREIEGHKAESRACSILIGLQFDQHEIRQKPSKEFSGGWRMRISLARALFMTPELLILDEPTNHLDLSATIWLEQYLSTYKKTLLSVSHDESMLNECVDNIIHFFNKKLYRYRGNYDNYVKTREQNKSAAVKKRHAQDVKIKKDRKIAQNAAGKKLGARKKKEVERGIEERIEIVMDEKAPQFNFPDVKDKQETAVIKFDDVSYGYSEEGETVIKDLSFGIYMDSKIALVGANGSGKSTIMKLISKEILPVLGDVNVSAQFRVIKYDQHVEQELDLEITPLEWLDRFASLKESPQSFLGRFGLHGNLVSQKIGTLSGGQKARLVFATLSAQGPHLLLLDEPTNHLDIFAIEALTEGLKLYQGGLVIISHNTKILSECCNQIWVVKDKIVTKFEGTFDQYKKSIIDTLV